MTYRLLTFYCARCKTGTPHEYDTEQEKARCTICADKKIRAGRQSRMDHEHTINRHIAALDGMGNRGPKSRRLAPPKQIHSEGRSSPTAKAER
jgi:DNA-directed RNA polymerase subunit RPC12/RpoP